VIRILGGDGLVGVGVRSLLRDEPFEVYDIQSGFEVTLKPDGCLNVPVEPGDIVVDLLPRGYPLLAKAAI
jgi:hypothetical protein